MFENAKLQILFCHALAKNRSFWFLSMGSRVGKTKSALVRSAC
jgi:hypothetical protein